MPAGGSGSRTRCPLTQLRPSQAIAAAARTWGRAHEPLILTSFHEQSRVAVAVSLGGRILRWRRSSRPREAEPGADDVEAVPAGKVGHWHLRYWVDAAKLGVRTHARPVWSSPVNPAADPMAVGVADDERQEAERGP